MNPVQAPSGTVRLVHQRTLVAGGLSSLLTNRWLLGAADAASRTCGRILYAASRLLLLYAVSTLSGGENFADTGLANENKAWAMEPDGDPAPTVFTQELCEWAINVFSRATKRSPRDVHPAFIRLKQLAVPLVAEIGLQDNSNLRDPLQSLAKSLSVVINNHLTVACLSHTTIYLRAKYAHLHLSKKEATQLAKTIGRSVQWNAVRASKQPGGQPYNKLPPKREAKVWSRASGNIHVPQVLDWEWQRLVDAERALLPATWRQLDMLQRRYEMLEAIRQVDAPLAGFNLLPLCRSGRVFLKLNTAGLLGLCTKAGVNVSKDNILSIFDSKKLHRLLRHPSAQTIQTLELDLAGEFFRTDGIQAQFVCGVKRGAKRKVDGKEGEEDEDAVEPTSGMAVEDDDFSDNNGMVPESVENLFACDPGKVNLFNVSRARKVTAADAPPGAVPLGDGQYVVWDEVLKMSKGEFDDRRGTTKRRKQRAAAVAQAPAYRVSLGVVSRNPLSIVDPDELRDRLVLHFRSHAAIHAFEASRAVARLRFEAYMGKQQVFAHINTKFKSLLGDKGVCAWGGARWAHAAKGSAPCPAAMVYRKLTAEPWARRRFPREAECNTSCKCSNCLLPEKMVHPHHQRVYSSRWTQAGGRWIKAKVGLLGGGRVYGLYQCTTGGCYRTWSRDRNAPANIGRCYWERAHGRERPAALRPNNNN